MMPMKKFVPALAAALGCLFATASCDRLEPDDPATLIPDWRTYSNYEAGIEFQYPYTLNLDVESSTAGQLVVELQWVGRGTPVFRMESREAMPGELAATNAGAGQIGGLRATVTATEIDGEPVERWTVVREDRAYDFTGSGTSFEKVLDSVRFLDPGMAPAEPPAR